MTPIKKGRPLTSILSFRQMVFFRMLESPFQALIQGVILHRPVEDKCQLLTQICQIMRFLIFFKFGIILASFMNIFSHGGVIVRRRNRRYVIRKEFLPDVFLLGRDRRFDLCLEEIGPLVHPGAEEVDLIGREVLHLGLEVIVVGLVLENQLFVFYQPFLRIGIAIGFLLYGFPKPIPIPVQYLFGTQIIKDEKR